MQVSKTTTYNIKFFVVYHESTEGGMFSDTYGDQVDTIAEALELLEEASHRMSDENWKICLDVTKQLVSAKS